MDTTFICAKYTSWCGKISEDDEDYSKPVVHSVIQSQWSRGAGDWTDVKKALLYYTLLKALQNLAQLHKIQRPIQDPKGGHRRLGAV